MAELLQGDEYAQNKSKRVWLLIDDDSNCLNAATVEGALQEIAALIKAPPPLDIYVDSAAYAEYTITLQDTDPATPPIVLDLSPLPTDLCNDTTFISSLGTKLAGDITGVANAPITGDGTNC